MLNPRLHVAPLEGPQGDARLRQLDIPGFPPLSQALSDGAGAFRACTHRHPASYRGTRMWGETFASLSYNLARSDWEQRRYMNVDLLIHRSRRNAIIVTAADEACGHRDIDPQVKHERGEVISTLANGASHGLFSAQSPLAAECRLWFLLHRVRQTALDAELSAPLGVGREGLVTGWIERILIPGPSITGGGRIQPSVPQPSSPVDVDVTRRSA